MLLIILGYLVCSGLSFYIFSRSLIEMSGELTLRDLIVCTLMALAGPAGLIVAIIDYILCLKSVNKFIHKVIYKKEE